MPKHTYRVRTARTPSLANEQCYEVYHLGTGQPAGRYALWYEAEEEARLRNSYQHSRIGALLK